MSNRVERFQVEGTPRISLRLPAGEARVVGGDPGSVEVRLSGRESVTDRFRVEHRTGEVVIEPEGGRLGRWSGVDVEIAVGVPAELRARLTAGDVEVLCEAAALTVEAGSGDVAAGRITGDARIKTAFGDFTAATIGGRLEAAAASGDIRVGTVAGDVEVKTAAGDIVVGAAGGSVTAHSASGDIEIGRFTGDSFNAKTLSGDVLLGVTAGRKFAVSFQTLSGDVRTDFPVDTGGSGGGSAARLAVKTMSGDVVVKAAD